MPARPIDSYAREARFGWLLVCAASLTTLVLLASAGRIPGVDLPEHALFLRRIAEGGDAAHQVRWVVPYTLLFLLALPIAKLSDPVRAIWCATAFAIALLPIASATLASAQRRSPALGLLAYLAAFSSIVAWGFSSLVLGASMFAFTIAAALVYARSPTKLRGAVVALLLVLAYSAHMLAWLLALLGALAIVCVRRRKLRLRDLWPIALGGACTIALLIAWRVGFVEPWQASMTVAPPSEQVGWLTRLIRLADEASQLGRIGELVPAWLALAGVLALVLASSFLNRSRVRARLVRLRSRQPARAANSVAQRALVFLRRNALLLAWLASFVAYLFAPVRTGIVFLVYPRALVFWAVLAPAAAFGRRTRIAHWLGALAFVPALALVLLATREVRTFAESTKCIDRLTSKLRAGESLLTLRLKAPFTQYPVPLDAHVASELMARRGGTHDADFTDYGEGPVTYRPGYDRLIVGMMGNPTRYDHRVHGREFTAWLLVGAPEDLGPLLVSTFGTGGHFEVHRCEAYALVTDVSVPAGSRKADVFLPHFHASGVCSVAAHAAQLAPPPE